MSKHFILQTKRVNLDNMRFSDVKKNSHGGNMIYIKYHNDENNREERFTFQTPKMACPFGLSESKPNEGEAPKYSLELSFGNPSRAMQRYHKIVGDFDEKMKNVSIENCKAWFKRTKMSMDIANENYTNHLRRYKDPETGEFTGKYADTVRFKLPQTDSGAFRTEFYDEEGMRIEIASPEDLKKYVTKGCKVIAIVQCSSVWFVNGKYGVSWSVVQAQLFPSGGFGGACAIQEDPNDEEEI